MVSSNCRYRHLTILTEVSPVSHNTRVETQSIKIVHHCTGCSAMSYDVTSRKYKLILFLVKLDAG